MFGGVHFFELGSLVCLALCGAYHVRPKGALLFASLFCSLVMGAVLLYVLVVNEWHGWYWERGWWHLVYFPGFSLFYTGVTFYASLVMRDLSIEQGIEELARLNPIQAV